MQRLSECMCLLGWDAGSRDVDGGGTTRQATTRVSQWLSIPTGPHDKDILVSIRNGRLEPQRLRSSTYINFPCY